MTGMAISRRAVTSGLVGAALLGGSFPAFAQHAGGPPPFESTSAQFRLLQPARPLPSVRLVNLAGATTELAALRGKVVLLNFWATWCAACRTELPSLDRLQQAAGAESLHVAAISTDREGAAKVGPYLRRLALRRLAIYIDPDARIAYSSRENLNKAPLALYGMPISYIVDRTGHARGYVLGAADWTSPSARNLLQYFLDAA